MVEMECGMCGVWSVMLRCVVCDVALCGVRSCDVSCAMRGNVWCAMCDLWSAMSHSVECDVAFCG
eukprot:3932955-Rhodomonas_salina.1